MRRSNLDPQSITIIPALHPATQELIEFITTQAKNPLPGKGLKRPIQATFSNIIHYMAVFLEIDKTAKDALEPELSDRMIAIHGLESHPTLAAIKINLAYLHVNKQARFTPVISLDYKNKEKAFFICCGSLRDELVKRFNLPLPELEFYRRKPYLQRFHLLPPAYWNNWEHAPLQVITGSSQNNSAISVRQAYDECLDPIIIQAFLKYTSSLRSKLAGLPFTVLDAGAGKGRLAKKIIAAAKEHDIALHYIFLEPNKSQCEIAQRELASINQNQCRITFVDKMLKDFRSTEPVHCVISLGGPLNAEVSTRSSALTDLETLQRCLVDDGILIATGISPLLLKDKYFAKGFTVLDYTLPPPQPVEKKLAELFVLFGKVTCYVCQKKPEKDYSLIDSRHYFSKLQAIVTGRTYPYFWNSAPEHNATMTDEVQELEKDTPHKIKIWTV